MLLKRPHGFTIVELLIVIVVIAVLAAITVVAYNGIQTRAKNIKTVNAAVGWVKILKLYNADKGTWPTSASCLGTPTTYEGNGGLCWPTAGWVVNSTFLSQVQPYTSTYPEPDTTDIATDTNSPRRGLMYNTNLKIYLFQAGSTPSSCPDIGLKVYSGPSAFPNGYQCLYDLV